MRHTLLLPALALALTVGPTVAGGTAEAQYGPGYGGRPYAGIPGLGRFTRNYEHAENDMATAVARLNDLTRLARYSPGAIGGARAYAEVAQLSSALAHLDRRLDRLYGLAQGMGRRSLLRRSQHSRSHPLRRRRTSPPRSRGRRATR